MKVKITSPCMSMLVYESAKSSGQTEGCLQGELATEVTKNITDSDVTTLSEEVLSIHSICPLILSTSNKENKSIRGTNIFGWYKFCRRPLLRLSVREKSIHRKLAKSINEKNGFPAHLVTVLMQERWSENQSTYLWKFAAFLQRDRWFVPCRVEVVNLKASTCGAYKPYPSVQQQHRLPQVTKALNSLSDSFFSPTNNSSFHMVRTVRNSGQDIVKSLNETISKLRSTETELEAAYTEQDQLKKALQDLQSSQEKEAEGSSSFFDPNLSADSNTTDSSESEDYYGAERVNDPTTEGGTNTFEPPANISAERNCPGNVTLPEVSSRSNPSQNSDQAATSSCQNNLPYDPFDSLVGRAKADLKPKETCQPGCSKDEDK